MMWVSHTRSRRTGPEDGAGRNRSGFSLRDFGRKETRGGRLAAPQRMTR
jgi:hypothetical protein